MAKTIKLVFFNPITLSKRVTNFIFNFDYYNHCWKVTISNLFGESTHNYSGSPMDLVERHKNNMLRIGEYATIKVK